MHPLRRINKYPTTGDPTVAHPLYCGSHLNADPDRLDNYERTSIDSGGVYTFRELRFMYEVMCNREDYKGGFQTTIAPDLLAVATRAVRYFTNEHLQVIGTDHQTGRLIVKSPGQR